MIVLCVSLSLYFALLQGITTAGCAIPVQTQQYILFTRQPSRQLQAGMVFHRPHVHLHHPSLEIIVMHHSMMARNIVLVIVTGT